MNILFLAYRDWAIEVYPSVANHPCTERVVLAKSTKEMLLELEKGTYDLILMCGWSEEPVKDVVERIPTFTAHCAADDKYSPGTPLQNQINDGVRFTKHRLVRVGYPELSLRQYSHEVDLDISGSTADIFLQLKATCIMLFNMFLYDYPDVEWRVWPVAQEQRKKRTPADSQLKKGDFSRLDTRQLYDFIRGLEEPYPNAYLEDDVGKLFFSKVAFKKKGQ